MKIHICETCQKQFTKRHNPQRIYRFCSYRCRAKGLIQKHAGKHIRTNSGRTHFTRERMLGNTAGFQKGMVPWNKGIGNKTPLSKRLRTCLAYRAWRRLVFERDNYTCQFCGKIGGKLNADHIQRFADHPEKRFDVSNGRTLCVECHLKTKTFGNRKAA